MSFMNILMMLWIGVVTIVIYGFWAVSRDKKNLHANIFKYIKEKIIIVIQSIRSQNN